jgi:hypothetical protein
MRTTLTLDDHVARTLKERAHRSGKPFKQIVNETLRTGLGATGVRRSKPYKIKPAALGGVMPGITWTRHWRSPTRSRIRSSLPRCACASDPIDANLLIYTIDSDAFPRRAAKSA